MRRDFPSLVGAGGENGERVDHENEPAGFMSCRAMPGDRLGAIAEAGRSSPCARHSKDKCQSSGPGAVQARQHCQAARLRQSRAAGGKGRVSRHDADC